MLDTLQARLERYYQQNITDYWIRPQIKYDEGVPVGRMQDGDLVVFACRRGEREIQLTESLTQAEFDHFERTGFPSLQFFPLVDYHPSLKLDPLFPVKTVEPNLGQVVSNAGLSQLRIAESEKFAHITYFLSGRKETPFPNEYRIRVPSLALNNLHPKMASLDLAEALLRQAEAHPLDFIALNFAAGDIWGHVADFASQVACVEYIDQALSRIIPWGLENGYYFLITADHGLLETGEAGLGHSSSLVPLILAAEGLERRAIKLKKGKSLTSVAPTVLELLGLEPPSVMDDSLLEMRLPRGEGVILIVLDGFGLGKADHTNPIHRGATLTLDALVANYPTTELVASGEAVGLLAGSSGNSEAGHLSLGAGRRIAQDEVRILEELKDGRLRNHYGFNQALRRVGERNAACHLLFLLSKQSSHGSLQETLEILNYVKEQGISRVTSIAYSMGAVHHLGRDLLCCGNCSYI